MKRIKTAFVALAIGLGLTLLVVLTTAARPLAPATVRASTHESTGDVSSRPLEPYIVTWSGEAQAQQVIIADHSVVGQFEQIPKAAVDRAGAIETLFMHQSTGNNIDFLGLRCLAGLNGDPESFPPECITYADNYPSGWPLYPQTWNWEGWPTPMADGRAKTDQFVSIVRSRQQDFDVLGMKFCYVDAWNQDFDYYRTQMEQLQSDYPTKTFIWATMVILGQDGIGETCYTGDWFNNCESIQLFNDQLRAYAGTHNIYLYDMADIESDGGRCYINGYRRYEILCPEYYDGWGGGGGGHPDVEGSIALAKGFWWLMARLAGWDGELSGISEKTASIGAPVHGQTVTYTIVVQGLAAPLTVSVYLTDVVPTGLSYVPGTLTATAGIVASMDAPTLRWSGLLTPTPVVTVTYAVTVSTTASEAITNSAIIVAPGYQTVTRTATIQTHGPSALNNTKNTVLTHDPAWPGDRITYTIAVRNTGPADAVDVHITDTLPSQVIGADVDVTYTITAGHSITITVPATVTNDAPWGATLTNTAYYKHSTGSGFADAVFTIIGPPQLSITKSVMLARNPVQPGDAITYTIVVRNTGPADAAGVHITDTLPSQVIGAKVDVTRTVAAGGAVTVTVPATVTSSASWGAIITNTAYYCHSTGSDFADAVFTVVGLPQLSITKSVTLASGSVLLGQSVTYAIALSNTSQDATTGVVMTDVLPAALDFGDWVEQSGAIQDSHTITWTGDISAATQVAVAFTAILDTDPLLYGQTITNTAHFESANAQGGSVSVAFTIPAPDLSRSTKAVSATTVKAGELVTYTIILSNTGSLNATVRYTDTLPTEVEWVSGDLSGTVEVNAGESVTIVISAQVKMDVADFVVFHNSIDINDGYHPTLTRNSPATAVSAFRIYLPLVANNQVSNTFGLRKGLPEAQVNQWRTRLLLLLTYVWNHRSTKPD